ncbi:MAG TPA: ATP-grasp domain-containing protein [Planctomycetaceae bacterium]|jgi:predicted ATP-grasp superfamily ATP-dependent carboligase|nr:ATP-grasp domain-containing protein [Planctomycetaceae bacterium]
MRVFVSEYVCGGAWPEAEFVGSLAREGQGMLAAVVADFARILDIRVTTTWDARLGTPPFQGVHTVLVDTPHDELPIFRELADLCDATLVIAPETQGVLENRTRIVERTTGRLLGPASAAIRLCGDKLATADYLASRGICAVPTGNLPPIESRASPSENRSARADVAPAFPLVLKPRDGAGSQDTYLIRSPSEFIECRRALAEDPSTPEFIWQPYVPGRAVSVAALVSPATRAIEVLPPAEQTLSDDGRFKYFGGVIPARGVDLAAIEQAARDVCLVVEGLRGYVGIDLVVPEGSPDRPVVVEINPRLTTSYTGYRRLTDENLAERMLGWAAEERPIRWREQRVSFDAAGRST